MKWISAITLGLALFCCGCGRGYESENRAIVSELPAFDGVGLLSEEYEDFCSSDSCPLGDDRSSAVLAYSVDTSRWTQLELADAYEDALPRWESTVEQRCIDEGASRCETIVVAWFERGAEHVGLSFENWSVGSFEVHVDARGAGSPS